MIVLRLPPPSDQCTFTDVEEKDPIADQLDDPGQVASGPNSIVGDVLYSIATGEEEGKPRQRILAFAAKR